MLALCPPAGVGDQDAELELAAVEGFFDGWVSGHMDPQMSRKRIDQDGRIFQCVVAPHPRIPYRWTWQLLEDVGEWTECLLAEGFAGSEERARQLCLLGLAVMLSDDRPNPLAVHRASYDLYAD